MTQKNAFPFNNIYIMGILIVIILLVAGVVLYVKYSPKFGGTPSATSLARMKASPNYKNGVFQNQIETPAIAKGYSTVQVFYEFLFKKIAHAFPLSEIPHVQTDLKNIPIEKELIIWFGHSSYYLQTAGKRFLVDPVFSGNASPIAGTTTSFLGSNTYQVQDLPEIDYLLISHDHYDHLDYETILQLKDKVAHVITGLGVAAHFERWGYQTEQITELDWYDDIELDEHIKLIATPGRHFSGRTFKRNTSLWLSFVLLTPKHKLFLGGDSGYGPHFNDIGKKYGPFDLAIIENGQYDPKWAYIHLLPEQQMQVAKDLNAAKIMPVHSSKFKLSQHAWKEPLEKISQSAAQAHIPLVTPKIGEIVDLNQYNQVFESWWEQID